MSEKGKGLSVILGLGMTGLSCARYLTKQKQPFAIMDSRAHPPYLEEFHRDDASQAAVEVVMGHFSESLLNQAQEIIVSPGLSLKHPLLLAQMERGKSIIGDIELFARAVNKPIIAITGSNGKTTVTTLMGLMMKQAGMRAIVCGNMGAPVLEQLSNPCDYYVLEISSFQLETTFSLRPKVAALLNISPDHMDRYADLQEYTRAKQRVYLQCQHPIVNADEPEIWKNTLAKHQIPLSFGFDPSAHFSVRGEKKACEIVYQEKPLIGINALKLQAHHHVQNALAALAIGFSAGLSMDAMLMVLHEFSGIKHRCQWIRRHQEVDYYNDSKGTNVGATLAALASLGPAIDGRIILIAGGQGKGADFSSLNTLLKKYVKTVILIGRDADLLEKTFCEATRIKRSTTMEEAVLLAAHIAEKGDAVLLSPACASFDMFKNFEARGDVFINHVEQL